MTFSRHVKLTIGDPTSGNGLVIEDLRIDFDVTKITSKSPDVATISVYNLSPEHRRVIEQRYTNVILEYGTRDELSVIYAGEVFNQTITKQGGVDLVLNLFCGSGSDAHARATANLTVGAGQNMRDVLMQVGADLQNFGVEFGLIDAELAELEGTGSRPATFSGLVGEQIDKLLRDSGFTWNTENNRLNVIKAVTDTRADVILHPDTGLIGTVRRTQEGFDFDCLLNPAIRPGVTVGVFSRFIETANGVGTMLDTDNGGYVRPIRVQHKGTNTIGNATTSVVGVL